MKKLTKKFAYVLGCFALFFSLDAYSMKTSWDHGRNEAFNVCRSLAFSSDVMRCMEIVNQAYYYDPYAPRACLSFVFSDDKINCISVIANKTYTPIEVDTCTRIVFTDERMTCLERGGRPYQDLPRDYIRQEVFNALQNLRMGFYGQADLILQNLLYRLDGVQRP